jgi:2-amino-4-hydroxy-6-hydroxymethyldihydropteridine diphosphokinase
VNGIRRRFDPAQGERVYLGLGANLGDRLGQLRQALFALITHPELAVTAVSRLYESQHVGVGEQPDYLNACVALRTWLAPRILLTVLKGTEGRLGRAPDGHGRPRLIDLDILLYGDLVWHDSQLTIPHPALRERAFVLRPLRDIAPDVRLPDSPETVAGACAKISARRGPWIREWTGELLPAFAGSAGKENWRAALAVYGR